MKRLFRSIYDWFVSVARVIRRQFHLTFTDLGVMTFFLFLPLVYPLIYSLIYNPEVTRDMPVVVVDDCRTAMSREFVRQCDATEAISIIGYAANMSEARECLNEHRSYAILEIPKDYEQHLGRGEQGVVHFYCDMSLLFRYRTFLMSLTTLQVDECSRLRQIAFNTIGIPDNRAPSSIQPQAFMLGDTQQGFASFIIPGIVVLVLQQAMLLGISMLSGWSNERRRKYGFDPFQIRCSASATVLGKGLAFTVIFFPLAIFTLHFVPEIFHYPHIGDPLQYLALILPMLMATSFLGISIEGIMRERETCFIAIVFTSVIFLFLSGLTWPRYAMNPIFVILGNFIPATWAVEGFVQINSTGAGLNEVSAQYLWLWGLVIFYMLTAVVVTRYRDNRRLVPASVRR